MITDALDVLWPALFLVVALVVVVELRDRVRRRHRPASEAKLRARALRKVNRQC